MSEMRIGLIAEGPTDTIIIEAALKAFLPTPFVLTQIQPEEDLSGDYGQLGGGWGGVYRYFKMLNSMGNEPQNWPELFDMMIVHLDADVAEKSYDDYGITNDFQDLPCSKPCPPASDTTEALKQVANGWLEGPLPSNWVYCIPSKYSETWMVAALNEKQSEHIECDSNLITQLGSKPFKLVRYREGKLKKQSRKYREAASRITEKWHLVEQKCSLARVFREDVINIVSDP